MMQILAELDVTTVRAAELYLEVWGGHPGTANKRVTVNGRSTYALREDGTAERLCAHQYPSVPLRLTDVLRGYNVFQFACDRGNSFWGHFIVDEACLRLELPAGHAALDAAGLAGFVARVEPAISGETIALTLAAEGAAMGDIASVEFFWLLRRLRRGGRRWRAPVARVHEKEGGAGPPWAPRRWRRIGCPGTPACSRRNATWRCGPWCDSAAHRVSSIARPCGKGWSLPPGRAWKWPCWG
jgi:hypothetical protein